MKCLVPVKPQLRGAPFAGSNGAYAATKLLATLGHSKKAFVRVTMKKTGSSFRFDMRYCKKR